MKVTNRYLLRFLRSINLYSGLLGVVAFFLIFQIFQPLAMATHFRYGHLTWEKRTDISPNTVAINLTAAFRRDGYSGSASDGHPQIGDVIVEDIGETKLYFGDGNSTDVLFFEVTSYDETENWIIGKAEIPTSRYDKEVIYTYPVSSVYTLYIQSCCRLSASGSHVNNPDGYYRLETDVDLTSSNTSPVSSGFPIVTVEQNSSVSFNVPANDADGDTLAWRVSTSAEASGSAGGFSQPLGLAVDSSTGNVSWNTTGVTLGLYSTQLTIEDGNTSIPVDFFIKVTQQTTNNSPIFDVPPTPEYGTTYTVNPGELVGFNVQASDQDSGDTVELNHAGLPSGATFDIPSAANPVSSTFSWTPAISDSGSYVVSFKAIDKKGLSAEHSINITVLAVTPTPSPSPSPTPPLVGIIVGTVSDASTGLPIQNATVSTDIGGYSSTTDASGNYILEVDPNNYSLTASATGYNSSTQSITVSAGAPTVANFSLTSVAPTPTPTPANGVIYGFVYDEDEMPMRSVSMTLTGPNSYSESSKTDEDGYYSFEGLAAGDYTVRASKSGYQPASENVSLGEGESSEVDFNLEETTSGSIYGFVTDIYGEPIENVRITLKGLKTRHNAKTASDRDGFFEFTDLDADKYVIKAKKKRYRLAKKTVEIEERESKEIEIEMRRISRIFSKRH